MDPRSQKAAQFVSEMLYGVNFDFAMKQAVRHQQPLEEVLEHSSIVKVVEQFMVAEKLAVTEDPGQGPGASVSSTLASLLPEGNFTKLSLPENSTALELTGQTAEAARKQVRSQISTLDGSMSLEKMAKQLRTMDVLKMRGTAESSVLIVYNLNSAGEHEKEPRRSPCPMRRDHLDKVLKAIMSTRGPLPDFEGMDDKIMYPQLDPSDM